MAYIVVSQHTYKDDLKHYVTMTSTATTFTQVEDDIKDYINNFNQDDPNYLGGYGYIDDLNVSKFKDFNIGQRPTLDNPNDTAYKGGYFINFIMHIIER